ncbi:MAG: hypothetical protein LBE13_11565 [Bacteroidales bacterium]|jgi:hypothetical protein|nr:hypothetical protein [Bacteroidales bacterium]
MRDDTNKNYYLFSSTADWTNKKYLSVFAVADRDRNYKLGIANCDNNQKS